MRLGIVRRDVLPGPPDDRAELDFPVDPGPAPRKDDRLTISHYRASTRLHEEVWHTAIFATLTTSLLAVRVVSGLVDVTVEVHGCVQNFPRIHDRRQRLDFIEIVDPLGTSAGDHVVRHDVVHDLVQASLHAVLVARDQLEHVGGKRNRRIRGVSLQRGVRSVQLDDVLVAQYDRDLGCALDFEGADFEWLHYVHLSRYRGGRRDGEWREREQQ